jgi:hypothetical protein
MICDAASMTIWYAVSKASASFSHRVRAFKAQFGGSWNKDVALRCHYKIFKPVKPPTYNQPGQYYWLFSITAARLPYILESNPHPFYSFRGLKNQMRIRFACGLDSRSRAGFWKNDWAAVRAIRTIQYNNILFYYLL